jgi:hypothetical protein
MLELWYLVGFVTVALLWTAVAITIGLTELMRRFTYSDLAVSLVIAMMGPLLLATLLSPLNAYLAIKLRVWFDRLLPWRILG